MEVIDLHQPGAAVFNMGRPSIRWIGNEDGLAADPCCYAVSQTKISAFTEASDAISDNKIYLPPECDVAVRRHWFWQTDDLQTLKTKEHLLGIWYRSIGRGANLLLNLGPDRDGLLDEHDTSRVLEVAEELKARFENPIAARVTKIDGGCELDFGKEVDFDHLVLREEYSRGQRVDGYVVSDEKGNLVTSGQTIGHQKWHAFPKVKLHKLRIAWSEKTVEGATLQSAEAYRTGFETLPQVGEELDYGAWSEKADARENDAKKWSKP